MKLRTFMAGVAGVLAIIVTIDQPRVLDVPAPWRQQHAAAVRAAVLSDLITMVEGIRENPTMGVCASVEDGPAPPWLRADPLAVERLVDGGSHPILPQSECHMKDCLLVDSHEQAAARVRVSGVEWVSPDFVRIKGEWFQACLGAAAYRFTVSRVGGRWRVDTASLEHFA
jgi:hypothetical protein